MTYVIIPAFEPDAAFVPLLKTMSERGHCVIAVNDGSSAAAAPLFAEAEAFATVLHHPQNRGKGAAIKTALEYISAQPRTEAAYLGVMDADGQHTPEDMERVFACAAEHPDSLVLGVRQVGKDMPLRSRFGNAMTRNLFHFLSGVRVSDTQTGLRACAVELIPTFLEVSGERYEYETNVLLSCASAHIPMPEVPIQTIYHDTGNSCSHFRVFRDSFRIYRDLLKFAGSSGLSFCIDYLLFCLFFWLFGGQKLLANVLARCISAPCNYLLNCRYVFKKKPEVRSALQYLGLAGCILVLNSLILTLLSALMPAQLAKLLTELVLFLLSFGVQRLLIFRRGAKKRDDSKKKPKNA